jgi:2-dehydro-3-deoxyphosphogluconate aldolase/(4S)-4-hydroxy-2-oxoglutarate aldolase
VNAGLTASEVPLNTASATQALQALAREGQKRGLLVGAGTVRSDADLERALDAGAQFIVSPNTNPAIVQKCVSISVPCVPGALTPTEVQNAFEAGAWMVKVFPVGCVGGAQYIKELRGPFKDIPLMACGGVRAENAQEYLAAGANCLAFGASVFSVSDMENGNWDEIERRIKSIPL